MEQPMRGTRSSKPDPMADYHGKPFVGVGGGRFIGRVIIELHEVERGIDAHGLAWIVDPAPSVDQATVLNRIAEALPKRLAMDASPPPQEKAQAE